MGSRRPLNPQLPIRQQHRRSPQPYLRLNIHLTESSLTNHEKWHRRGRRNQMLLLAKRRRLPRALHEAERRLPLPDLERGLPGYEACAGRELGDVPEHGDDGAEDLGGFEVIAVESAVDLDICGGAGADTGVVIKIGGEGIGCGVRGVGGES